MHDSLKFLINLWSSREWIAPEWKDPLYLTCIKACGALAMTALHGKINFRSFRCSTDENTHIRRFLIFSRVGPTQWRVALQEALSAYMKYVSQHLGCYSSHSLAYYYLYAASVLNRYYYCYYSVMLTLSLLLCCLVLITLIVFSFLSCAIELSFQMPLWLNISVLYIVHLSHPLFSLWRFQFQVYYLRMATSLERRKPKKE